MSLGTGRQLPPVTGLRAVLRRRAAVAVPDTVAVNTALTTNRRPPPPVAQVFAEHVDAHATGIVGTFLIGSPPDAGGTLADLRLYRTLASRHLRTQLHRDVLSYSCHSTRMQLALSAVVRRPHRWSRARGISTPDRVVFAVAGIATLGSDLTRLS